MSILDFFEGVVEMIICDGQAGLRMEKVQKRNMTRICLSRSSISQISGE